MLNHNILKENFNEMQKVSHFSLQIHYNVQMIFYTKL